MVSCVAVELHRNAANGPMLEPPNVGKDGRDKKLSIVMVRAVAHVDSACTGIGVMRISEQKEKKQEKSAGFLFVAPRPGFPSSFSTSVWLLLCSSLQDTFMAWL